MGAVRVLQRLFPEPGRLQFIYTDLGDPKAVSFVLRKLTLIAIVIFHIPMHSGICFALN
jgi:UDP-arabinose 4-epimerase